MIIDALVFDRSKLVIDIPDEDVQSIPEEYQMRSIVGLFIGDGGLMDYVLDRLTARAEG